jgi:DNA-directed RNA polymerase specialized sigma24 family protein
MIGRTQTVVTSLVARAIDRAQAGDLEAIRFLYARYADDVYGYMRRIALADDQARAVTRRVFLELERLLEDYDSDEAFESWIMSSAHSLAAESHR